MENETKVEVKVDVTKIVKYVCIASAIIIAVIFGSSCAKAYMERTKIEE